MCVCWVGVNMSFLYHLKPSHFCSMSLLCVYIWLLTFVLYEGQLTLRPRSTYLELYINQVLCKYARSITNKMMANIRIVLVLYFKVNSIWLFKWCSSKETFHFWKKISAYKIGESVRSGGGWSLTICVWFSSNNFSISQPIYFILSHIVAYVKTLSQTCSIMTLTFRWPWHLTLCYNNGHNRTP